MLSVIRIISLWLLLFNFNCLLMGKINTGRLQTIRNMIDDRREELNLSKRYLSEISGVGRSMYNRTIAGEDDICLSKLLALCDVLGINVVFEIDKDRKPYKDRLRGFWAQERNRVPDEIDEMLAQLEKEKESE